MNLQIYKYHSSPTQEFLVYCYNNTVISVIQERNWDMAIYPQRKQQIMNGHAVFTELQEVNDDEIHNLENSA